MLEGKKRPGLSLIFEGKLKDKRINNGIS